MKKLTFSIVFVMAMVFADTVLADENAPITPGYQIGGFSARGESQVALPYMSLGTGYYNSSAGAHGLGMEGEIVWIHFLSCKEKPEGGNAGFRLEPGVKVDGVLDFANGKTKLDNINLTISAFALFGGQDTDDSSLILFDVAMFQMGFVYKNDVYLKRELLGFNLNLMKMYFHTSFRARPFYIFGGMRGGGVVIGKYLQMEEKVKKVHFQPFDAHLGFGVRIKSFSTFRITGSIDVFEVNAAEKVGENDITVTGGQPGGSGSNSSTNGYLSYLDVGGRAGFYKLFNSPFNIEYVYSWNMARDLDCLPEDSIPASERTGCSLEKWESLSVHRHMVLVSVSY